MEPPLLYMRLKHDALYFHLLFLRDSHHWDRFIDPTTGISQQVWFNPHTGKRYYETLLQEDDSPSDMS